jgi:alpha-tubulin suppressor-like RCC1 family protein
MNRSISRLLVAFLVLAASLLNFSCLRGAEQTAASSQAPRTLALLGLLGVSYDDSNQTISSTYDYPAAKIYTLIPSGAVAVSTGGDHDCALMDDGGVKCWGENDFGAVGAGILNSHNDPIDVIGLDSDITAISAGGYHTCALTDRSTVKCWGLNNYGQLGDGTKANKSAPVDVLNATRVKAVSAGGSHTCYLSNASRVWCFGRNGNGQLGNGTNQDQTQPGLVSLGVSITQVVTGIYHTCVLTNSGNVKCFGHNGSMELGDGTNTDRNTPVDVQRLSGVKEISSRSGLHTCALLESGEVKCWGWNGFGQLGDGSYQNRSTPVTVVGLSSGATAISAGGYHTCALLSDGTVQCWGKNTLGELANGGHDAAPKPSDVVGISSVTAVSAGGYAATTDIDDTCVLLPRGMVKCWGFSLTDY